MNRTLVNQALEKAEKYEKECNLERANYWFNFAERAEKVYEKLEGKNNVRNNI